MSRYFLLLLLNLPFIIAAVLSAVTHYKLGRSSRRRLTVQVIIWVTVLIALASAEPIYTWLFSNELTTTEPLSLFDVVQITAIVVTFYIANRTRLKTQFLERRLQDLHQELSIRLSKD
ncbi:MAG TPA: hypothetical protein VK497_05400 [Candidatus Saccharimonadales bacterium]|nr:hypothetical protein [Candidatus Saccharimonadales bacterium]